METIIENKHNEIREPSHCIDSPFYSVEFSVGDLAPIYQFKLRRSDARSMFVLIKENSDILSQIEVGNVLNMKFYTTEPTDPVKYFDTQIDEIKNGGEGRFSGHCLVGLSIIGQDSTLSVH